jgi:hypothetical protein
MEPFKGEDGRTGIGVSGRPAARMVISFDREMVRGVHFLVAFAP